MNKTISEAKIGDIVTFTSMKVTFIDVNGDYEVVDQNGVEWIDIEPNVEITALVRSPILPDVKVGDRVKGKTSYVAISGWNYSSKKIDVEGTIKHIEGDKALVQWDKTAKTTSKLVLVALKGLKKI